MLLPSDVARLVLGYLQEEGLTATSQAFIHESPNLKEYAEHTTADGTIPACVFSVFGKGLTTILNEYVAAKTKESCPEVPAVMTSLWKKLDFTLNQIKSLQNSPAISACQRTRSRIGLANMARQRVLTIASAGAVVCSSVSEANPIFSPAHTSNSMLGHSTPVSYTALHTRLAPGSGLNQQIHDGSRLLNTPRESPVQISVCEHRLNPGPMSPGRRKWDTPRKRGGGLSASSCPTRSATAVSGVSAEPQPEEVVDENFPQLVIQNARDKILGDRSLQEKLAENINKILANEPTPQTSKASSATMEPDQSIDEILGLQGEIHMSDDAIHDILEQTESDPAFQALFDLFDYNKTKFPDGEPGDGEMSSCQEESEAAGSSATVRLPLSDNPGTTQRDTNVSDTTSMTVKTKAGQDRKTRKSTGSTLLKKTVVVPSGRTSRIENSSAKLLVSHGYNRGASSAPGNSNKKASLLNSVVGVTPMDINEPLNTPPSLSDSMDAQEPATSTTKTVFSETTTVSSSRASTAFVASTVTSASNMDRKQDSKGTQGSIEQPATAPSSALSNQPAFLSPVQVELNNTVMPNADLSHVPVSIRAGVTKSAFTHSLTPECATSASSSVPLTAVLASSTVSTVAPFTSTAGLQTSAAVGPVTVPGPSASSIPASFSSCTPVAAAPDPSSTNRSTPSKAAADPNNIVSLKIIISDNQEEDTSSDPALNQAISSISGDKIPTIYLSSPAKSPGAPGTPKANLDEVAQAVSGLQSSEAQASPLSCKAGALIASPLTGTSQTQQSYVIHLPLDAANPPLPGATASYFLVTEPPNADAQTRQVLLPGAAASKGQPLPANQFGVKTPTHSQGFSTGSTLILPSPVKPMVLPISVMGQNTLGNVQMVSNQLVAIPSSVPGQQSETVKPPTVAMKQCATAGTEENVVHKVIPPVSAENSQQDAAKGSSHRRILCFESSSEVQPQTSKTQTTTPSVKTTSTTRSVQQPEKEKPQLAPRTKPAILGGNKPKRRVEIVRCSADPQTAGGLVKEAEKSMPQQQKDPVKKNSRKQDHNIHKQESQSAKTSKSHSSQPVTLKNSETEQRSESTDRKYNHDKSNDEGKPSERRSTRSSSDCTLKSGTRKEKDDGNKKEPIEKATARSREGRTEKRAPSQETPSVTANKENEMKGSMQEQQQQSTSSSDFSPPAATQPMSNSQSKAAKPPSKTSSLAKQAAEMLHDIQGINPPSTPVKKPGAVNSDISLPQTPATGCNQEESTDSPRTPSQQKKGKSGEGTPKRLMPPNTPNAPTCSPASEAGSENSINMAAHTLMILSRAAIARTGTPLKDSLRQDEAGEKPPTSSKSSKKRKQSSPTDSPPAKKESKRSPSKKKDREKKKLMDCFPHDLDVDKFLSSLHYDE